VQANESSIITPIASALALSQTTSVLHTVNGGDSWQNLDVEAKERSFDKVYFGDPQNGWLVSRGEAFEDASLYRTRDQGVSWKKVLSVKSP
jgi:photosystem II stability/assembly factor-like uncharacterized protein